MTWGDIATRCGERLTVAKGGVLNLPALVRVQDSARQTTKQIKMEQQNTVATQREPRVFNSLEEFMADEKFVELVQDQIRMIHTNRANVLKESKATRLKSSPFQKLLDRGLMNVEFLRNEYPKIEQKTSSLPAGERELIVVIVEGALYGAAEFYRAQSQEGGQQ